MALHPARTQRRFLAPDRDDGTDRDLLNQKAGIYLRKVFDQYLRTTNIPLFKYRVNGKTLSYSYERVVKGFAMPIRVSINGREVAITPNETVQTLDFPEEIKTFEVNRNFYIDAEKIDP